MPGSPKRRERRIAAGLPVAPKYTPVEERTDGRTPNMAPSYHPSVAESWSTPVKFEQVLPTAPPLGETTRNAQDAPAREGDAREYLRTTVDDRIDNLAEQLLLNAAAVKKYRFKCPHCGRDAWGEIADPKASTDAIDKLIALGYGRKTSDSSKHEGFVLERRIIRPDEEEVLDGQDRFGPSGDDSNFGDSDLDPIEGDVA